ncbi:hypothetical protein JHK86_021161 [Glycine max]|nr:hypothetical protein JHK86_021161 [Glycine max]
MFLNHWSQHPRKDTGCTAHNTIQARVGLFIFKPNTLPRNSEKRKNLSLFL